VEVTPFEFDKFLKRRRGMASHGLRVIDVAL